MHFSFSKYKFFIIDFREESRHLSNGYFSLKVGHKLPSIILNFELSYRHLIMLKL
jgi:hypothetical protein